MDRLFDRAAERIGVSDGGPFFIAHSAADADGDPCATFVGVFDGVTVWFFSFVSPRAVHKQVIEEHC